MKNYNNEEINNIVYETIWNHVFEGMGESENKIGKKMYFNDYERRKIDHAIDRIVETLADNLKA